MTRDATGQATVLVVGSNNRVELRPVTIERMVEDQWLIGAGLQSGERIVVDGFQRVRAGITVTPVPSRAKPGQPESAPSRAANNQETSQAQRPGVHTSQAAKELSDAALSGASVQ